MNYDDLGTRMKMYEEVTNFKLIRRMPVIIRIDGKAFHTFTKRLDKPFDRIVTTTMHETTKHLCEVIQNCVLGYTQSDEISLLLTDYKTYKTDAWFDAKIQKIVSISAAIATQWFNKMFIELHERMYTPIQTESSILPEPLNTLGFGEDVYTHPIGNIYKDKEFGALFDARCFNLNIEEVNNYFIWRQIDCYRNAINTFARSKFSHSQMRGMKISTVKEELRKQFSLDVDDGECIPDNILYGQTFSKTIEGGQPGFIPYVRKFKERPIDVSVEKVERFFNPDMQLNTIDI